jgi:AraC-like DNA-binding protein
VSEIRLRKAKDIDLFKLVELRKNHVSVAKIAQTFNCSETYVRKKLHSEGMIMPGNVYDSQSAESHAESSKNIERWRLAFPW